MHWNSSSCRGGMLTWGSASDGGSVTLAGLGDMTNSDVVDVRCFSELVRLAKSSPMAPVTPIARRQVEGARLLLASRRPALVSDAISSLWLECGTLFKSYDMDTMVRTAMGAFQGKVPPLRVFYVLAAITPHT